MGMNVMGDIILDYIICQKNNCSFVQVYAVFKYLARNVFTFIIGMGIMTIRFIASQPSISYRNCLLRDTSMICLQVNVTFSVSYEKDVTSDDVVTCAGIVKNIFMKIEKDVLLGLKKVKDIKPNDLPMITASYNSTKLDGFACPDGELLQNKVCGELLPV